MKRNILVSIMVLAVTLFLSDVKAQDKPAPSPAATVSTVIGLGKVSVTYSRPKMNGRKIFGDGEGFLVPYGKLYRTGANSGSIVTFEKDVIVQGTQVPAGSYLLLSVPGKTSWELILYSDTSLGGYVAKFDEKKVHSRYKLTPEKRTETVTTFTINITDISQDSMSANLEISWENTAVKLNITAK